MSAIRDRALSLVSRNRNDVAEDRQLISGAAPQGRRRPHDQRRRSIVVGINPIFVALASIAAREITELA
jgi:hypothetical protein